MKKTETIIIIVLVIHYILSYILTSLTVLGNVFYIMNWEWSKFMSIVGVLIEAVFVVGIFKKSITLARIYAIVYILLGIVYVQWAILHMQNTFGIMIAMCVEGGICVVGALLLLFNKSVKKYFSE